MRKQVFKTIAKIILAMTMMIMSCEFTSAQSICFCYKGAWSEWIVEYSHFSSEESLMRHFVTFYGDIYGVSDYSALSLEKNGVNRYEISNYAKDNHFVMPDPRRDVTPCVKRTCNATIKIAPYKKHPQMYNIWFDGIGVGIDIRYLKF